MQRKILILGILVLFSGLLLFGDVVAVPDPPKVLVNRGGSTSDSYSHIRGFSTYPERNFYILETIKNGAKLVVHPITGDSITVDEKSYSLKPDVVANKYLSWDPILAGLKEGQVYKWKDIRIALPDLHGQGIDYGRPKRQTIEIPVLDYIGFERIDHYYTIDWFDTQRSAIRAEFELRCLAEEWQHPQFVIRSIDEQTNTDIRIFLDEHTRDYSDSYEFWEMQKQDLTDLLAFVPLQPGWELDLRVPIDKVKVYSHKGSGMHSPKYSLSFRVPITSRVLVIGLTALTALLVLFLFYKVVLKDHDRKS